MRPYERGVPLNKDQSERCQLIVGDNISPGPIYNPQISAEKLKACSWLHHPQTFL
jgi:hypothetical protein